MDRQDGNFSTFVTKTLNTIGYEWSMIQRRRKFTKDFAGTMNDRLMKDFAVTYLIAGSKREGAFNDILHGDFDVMVILDEVICSEDPHLFTNRRNLTVFKLDRNNSPPGYALLILLRHGASFNLVYRDAGTTHLRPFFEGCWYIANDENTYLSSERVIKTQREWCERELKSLCKNPLVTLNARTGPSNPTSTKSLVTGTPGLVCDNVISLPCHCPSVFERFRGRPRRHGWPSEHILQELSQLEAHVVPVGYKRSPAPYLEWRICFTQAEIRLIENLTEPQMHVFILLKIFAKEVLKEVWDVLTSYIMKNVLLWMVELIPRHKFRTDTVVDRFLDCLDFLRRCFQTRNLPNYMIAERNLLHRDKFTVKRRKVLAILDDCLQQNSSCLYRSSTLKGAMLKMYTGSPEIVKAMDFRQQIEILVMPLEPSSFFRLNTMSKLQDCFRVFAESHYRGTDDLVRICEVSSFPSEGAINDDDGVIHRIFNSLFYRA